MGIPFGFGSIVLLILNQYFHAFLWCDNKLRKVVLSVSGGIWLWVYSSAGPPSLPIRSWSETGIVRNRNGCFRA